MTADTRKTDYGIDAPGLVRIFFLAGAGLVSAAALTASLAGRTAWGPFLAWPFAVLSLYPLGMGVLMVVWSRRIKVRERETLLDRIDWRGDERVLDVGCGRGLMLVAAARRLSSGTAVGIDIWQASDQSSNTAEGTLRNAAIEGVLDRVEVRTADMRALPFEDDAFDVIVSHWAVHNLDAESDRSLAISEMARVLRPGGTILLADIENRAAYAVRFAELGLTDQRVFAPPLRTALLGAISFGSFRPTAILARERG